MAKAKIDLAILQSQLAKSQGRDYWRSMEQLANSAEFLRFLQREFPGQAAEWTSTVSRRQFLQLMGSSLGLAGLTACSASTESRPSAKIVPYVEAPQDGTPGQSLYFATAMQLGGYADGLLVESQMNRPTKIEGNPDHPASLGATNALAQASILDLYDPDRSKEVMQDGEPDSWDAFIADLGTQMAQMRANNGTGLSILTETVTSPTLFAQLRELLTELPAATWHQYEPVNRDNVYAGVNLAFGELAEPVYRLENADTIVTLDADLFGTQPGHVRHARDFADGRRFDTRSSRNRNRLYVVESSPTITGTMADHRLPLRASQIEGFARAMALELGISDIARDAVPAPEGWLRALVADLLAKEGASLVVAGDHQPPIVHALAHAMNEKLGNVGNTVIYTEPVVANPVNQSESLSQLVSAMSAGQVDMLVILGGNPVYTAPADLDFGAALNNVGLRIHLGTYVNESAVRCHWHIPEAHYLEAWSDARAYDGTITIQQPLIEPLYAGHSAHELIDAMQNEGEARSGVDILKDYWSQQQNDADFASFWQRSLHDGVVADSALPAKSVAVRPISEQPSPTSEEGLEINFRPDPTIWDGRFANNGWLQELPEPLTKLTWENAALINPLTADKFSLATGDQVTLGLAGRTVEAPVWLMPGHPEESITVHLGYGRTHAGRIGSGIGFDAYQLRTAEAPWSAQGLQIDKIGGGHQFATTQDHHGMEGRDLIREGTLTQFAEDPDFVHAMDAHTENLSLYPAFEYSDNAWGMAIDLNACNGCNACVIACQAENNIPIVGKEEVSKGREMHWIRLDRYYQGDLRNPNVHQQPVMCMHCENAPCEVVCPVGATMHDHEGLNTMIYNRCIGTRYCSNNCPYKVRRFNFLEYVDFDEESLKLQRNPEVTVRARGVMEKCTYCVQRISAARIKAKQEGGEIRDGEVVTACQGACPTRAIVFGNINDEESQVAQHKASALNYGLLTNLNTHPRTTYLAKLRNPNPELENMG